MGGEVSKHDGGQAFPVVCSDNYGNSVVKKGMSLREYYAGQALASLLAHARVWSETETATRALSYADAMIAALDEEAR